MRRIVSLVLAGLLVGCIETERKYYSDGTIQCETQMKKGVRDGKMTEYYDNGKVKSTQFYHNGRLDGKMVGYYENGKVGEEITYKNGRKIGNMFIYFESGALLEKQVYDLEGRLLDFSSYYENGIRDSTRQMPIFFLDNDTVSQGEVNRFYARLGNVDSSMYSKGKLYLANGIDQNEQLIDTFAIIESPSNRFECHFKEARKPGRYQLSGRMVFIVSKKSHLEQHSFLINHPIVVE